MRLRSLFVLAYVLVTTVPGGTHNDTYANQSTDATIDDEATVEVMLRLEGQTVAGEPKVVLANNTFDALHEKTGRKPLELKKTGPNAWKCYAVEDKKYVIGWIAKKGWSAKRTAMFGYCSEPFAAREGLIVGFSPGMPATFEYDLRNPPDGVLATPARVMLLREIIEDGKRTFLSWRGCQQEIAKPGILTISGLAAGTYRISTRISDATIDLNSRIPILYEDREVEIKSGIANRFDPNYPVIDLTVEDGDVTIRGTLYDEDKKPLAGRVVQVIPLASNGFDLHLYYPPSTTDPNGKFEFVGIRPNRQVYVSAEKTSVNLGKQSLAENASVWVDIALGLKKLPIVIGEPVDEIIIDWRQGGTGKLSDLSGKIVVLDVWATWCGPCIRALPQLNSLAAKLSDDGDVVFVALSTDHDAAVWKKTVDESGWNSLRHGRLDRKKNYFDFKRPIPYQVILDKNGIVRAEGNDLDVGAELEKLAKSSAVGADAPQPSQQD